MRRWTISGLSVLCFLLSLALPAAASAGWWTERSPIDGYGDKGFVSMGFDWQSNYFAWDGGTAFTDGIDYWKAQLLDPSALGRNPQANSGAKFKAEAFWGKFSLGYITGMYGTGIVSDSAIEFYQRLNNHTGVPGEQYNIGERSLSLTYQGVSLGYTSESSDSRWRWGIRCNLLQGLSYNEEENTGLATFTEPGKADALIFQDSYSMLVKWPDKKPCHGRGYSIDIYARYEPAPDWNISFSWQDLGQFSWPDAVHYRKTINYATEVDVNGNIIPPTAYGNTTYADHSMELSDFVQIGITKQYNGGDVTLGIEYRGDELAWGAGWRIKLNGTGKLLLNYDNRYGGFGVGWENDSLSVMLQTSSLKLNDAAVFGLGMTWKV